MSVYQFKLPDIGEGIAEAEIVAWHVKVGDKVEEDQQLADMMTDKATVEMESPVAGMVDRWPARSATRSPIGSVLVEIETEGADRPRSRPQTARRSSRWPTARSRPTPEQEEAIPVTMASDGAPPSQNRRLPARTEAGPEPRQRARAGPRLARRPRSARATSASTLRR